MAAKLLACRVAGPLLVLALSAGVDAMSLEKDFAPEEAKAQKAYKGLKEEETAAASAATAYCTGHKADPAGTPCCEGSTCYWDDKYPMQTYANKLPDVACDKKRGSTKCWGGSLFPYPKAGICICRQGGHCLNSQCSNKTGGIMGELGMYDVDAFAHLEPKQGMPWTPWCVCLFIWGTFAVTACTAIRVLSTRVGMGFVGSSSQTTEVGRGRLMEIETTSSGDVE